MFGGFLAHKSLHQTSVVHHIRTDYGGKYIYRDRRHRGYGIDKEVLTAFRKLTPKNVVWSRSGLRWRERKSYDPPGKRMVR
jgi:hypothetical protein